MMKCAALLLLGLGVVAQCGCGLTTRLKPMPVIYGPGRMDLCSMIPEGRRTCSLPVFYATNRKPDGPADRRVYGNDVGSSLQLGVSDVEIVGKKGDAGQASWADVCRASAGGQNDPTFRLAGSSDFPSPAAFYEAINRQLAETPNREVSVYVHGYYTKFDDAVTLLGKLLHCGARRGVVVCFSWPARQNALVYGGDVERARASAHYLADLIEGIAANTAAENVNVLAYSVGAACLTDALLGLRERHREKTPGQLAKDLRIGNVIYAASDIDTLMFGREQIVRVKELAQYVVIYISRNDILLRMVGMLGGGKSRLGGADRSQFTREEQEAVAKDPQIQVIDVSDVPGPQGFGGFAGHYYWYSNDWVMTDVVVTFRWQIGPDQRGLYQKPGMSRWYFPSDYPDKVTAAVRRLVPAAGVAAEASSGH